MEHTNYIKLEKFTVGTKPVFVGPFSKIDEAKIAIEEARTSGSEIVMGDQQPENIKNAIKAEILTKTEARKKGLRSLFLGDDANNVLETIPEPNEWDLALEKIITKKDGRLKENKMKTQTQIPNVQSVVAEEAYIPQKPVVQKSAPVTETEMPLKDLESQFRKPARVLIVSKVQFQGTVEWLARQGIVGEVVERYNPQQIRDAIVIGVLPPRLQILARAIGSVDIPGLKASQRGQPLSADELEEADARLRWYKVYEIDQNLVNPLLHP